MMKAYSSWVPTSIVPFNVKSTLLTFLGSIAVEFQLISGVDVSDAESTLDTLKSELESGNSVAINGTHYSMEKNSFQKEDLSLPQYIDLRSKQMSQMAG